MTALLLAVPLLVAAPVPKDFKKAEPLSGAWRLTGLEMDGRPSQFNKGMIWRFSDGQATLVYPGGSGPRTIALKTDPSARPPHFDFDNGKYQLGVYEVVGDKLTVCMGGNRQRPNGVAGGIGFLRYTFERAAGTEAPTEPK